MFNSEDLTVASAKWQSLQLSLTAVLGWNDHTFYIDSCWIKCVIVVLHTVSQASFKMPSKRMHYGLFCLKGQHKCRTAQTQRQGWESGAAFSGTLLQLETGELMVWDQPGLHETTVSVPQHSLEKKERKKVKHNCKKCLFLMLGKSFNRF